MPPLNYDPDQPQRKPRPIAPTFGLSTESMGNAIANLAGVVPGFNVMPQEAPGFRIPTPMGWLTPEMAQRMLTHLAPSREAIADTVGIPMDGLAWAARQLGARGIPGGYGEADPLTQAFDRVLSPGRASQPMWKPSADVPLSSANLRQLLGADQ